MTLYHWVEALSPLCGSLILAVSVIYGLGIVAADLRHIYMDWRGRQSPSSKGDE